MDYQIQKQILLIAVSIFTYSASSAYGYNVFFYSVEKPELNIHFKETSLLSQQKQTALFYVAMQMQAGPASDLTHFAKVSLNEMAALYKEESIKARHEHPPSKKKSQKLYRWSYSTLEYANHLQTISESIDVETPVELHIGSTGELLFIINGLPYIISSPLIRGPDKLDQRIINTICNENVCDLEFPELQREPPKKNIIIEAGWHINDKSQPEYVTNDGLHFIFSDIKNRLHKQNVCLNIIKELKLIAGVLRETSDKGIFVDWNYLNIESDIDGSHYRLIINSFGDAITFNLIELVKRPELTGLALSWIKAQVEDRPYQQYLYADDLLASVTH